MRNIFDQYSQPENKLTHSLITVLHEDPLLLKDFILKFGPAKAPPIPSLRVLEQSLPGKVEISEEAESQGLPDGLVFNDEGWALVIESKISSPLTKDQLKRHIKTVQRCGYTQIFGLAITRAGWEIEASGWKIITWSDIYKWASANRKLSHWAQRLVEYFNIAEARMAADEYLTTGTITTFSGLNFNPYAYLEGKRVLRLLMSKLREDKDFLRYMNIDEKIPGRSAITNQSQLWDFLSLRSSDKAPVSFTKSPHCTVSVNEEMCIAAVTLPNGMSKKDKFNILGDSTEEFTARLSSIVKILEKSVIKNGGRPFIKIQQRHYASQRAIPTIDGIMEFDIRVLLDKKSSRAGSPIKRQPEWVVAVYDLLQSSQSNIQLQVGVQFHYDQCPIIKTENADGLIKETFKAVGLLLRG